ncbi:MAG: hypothetical protein ACRD3Q_09365 [Terriglobales bacterium]
MRLTVLIVLSVFASQLPSPIPGKSRQPKQQHSQSAQQPPANQRGTEQSPVVVKVIPPPNNANEAEQERKDREQKTSHDRWLMVFSGVLAAVAVLQLLVYGYQAKKLKETVDATTRSADAAKKSADAIVNIERPWLLLAEAGRTSADDNKDGVRRVYMAAAWKFKNWGATPAFINDISGGLYVLDNIANLPKEPNYGPLYAGVDEPVLAPGQVSDYYKFRTREPGGSDEFYQLQNGEKVMVFYGKIDYVDRIGGDKHVSAFAYRFTFPGRERPGGFHFVVGGEAYNRYT